jgi:putative transcriptional regulator
MSYIEILNCPCHISPMGIRVNLDVMLARRKMSLTELAAKVGLSLTALSLFKTGKLKGVRFASLSSICTVLECQPGDILENVPDA